MYSGYFRKILTCVIFIIKVYIVQTMTTYSRIRQLGYSGEIHNVTTEDNYNCALERILPKDDGYDLENTNRGNPVLLLHGMFCHSFIFTLKASSLAFALADAGFDVWLYNSRGVGLSSINQNSTSEYSWQYSFHEMGIYDLPACVDYILNVTNRKTLDLVGYSLGGTITLIMLSERPEYNYKIRSSTLIAPAVRFKDTKRPLNTIKLFAPFFMEFLNAFEYFPYMNAVNSSKGIQKYCQQSKRTISHCKNIINILSGIEASIEDEMVLTISGTFPQPMSSKTVKHYIQSIVTGEFRQYDYGAKLNRGKYGDIVPPSYNISKVVVPTFIICSATDPIVTMKDINWLASRLHNVKEVNCIKNVPFGHLSYPMDTNSKELVVDYILDKLKSPD